METSAPPPTPSQPITSSSTIRDAFAGLVAGFFGLGFAELVSSIAERTQSPVLDVGDRAVDLAPSPLKNLAIEWFGTNDKIALLLGVGATLAIGAMAIGVVARRSARTAWLAILAFAFLGSLASVTGRNPGPWWAIAPALLGGLATIAALRVLLRSWSPSNDGAATPARSTKERRVFLYSAGGFLATAAVLGGVGRRANNRFSASESRVAVGELRADLALQSPPTNIENGVAGVSDFFTPNAEFYRIDTALTVPQLRTDTWTLRITGLVDRPIELTYDELLELPLVESDITLSCVSNEVGGGLLGTARWLGVRLDDLLEQVGIQDTADQIVGKSSDGYTCGFPVAALDGRDALIAVAMNGEPLPLQHGFPARLIVPGLYGYVSATKWLTEINLTRFEDFDSYWVPRGWDAEAPIKTQSRIDTPKGLQKLSPGPTAIAGVAWAQTRGIDRVEVQIDGGEWTETTLAEELNDVTWRQWMLPWDATPGNHTIVVRATDRTGETQTEDRAAPMPNGATGHHKIVVLVDEA